MVAQFNADHLLTESSSALVRDSLIKRARDLNIELDDVAINQYVIRYGVLEGSGGEAGGSARRDRRGPSLWLLELKVRVKLLS